MSAVGGFIVIVAFIIALVAMVFGGETEYDCWDCRDELRLEQQLNN